MCVVKRCCFKDRLHTQLGSAPPALGPCRAWLATARAAGPTRRVVRNNAYIPAAELLSFPFSSATGRHARLERACLDRYGDA